MSARTAVLVLSALLATGGCALIGEGKAAGATTKAKAVAVDLGSGGKQMVLLVTSKKEDGIFFTRPPYDLNGRWSARVAAGIFDPDDRARSEGALFTLEVDRREAQGNSPVEFYGISARRFLPPALDVLQVYSYSHNGVIEQTTFPATDAVRMEVFVNRDDEVEFRVEGLNGDGDVSLGSVPLASPSTPHQAGFGTFSAPKGARIGFTDFRLDPNFDPPGEVSAEHAACDLVMEAALAALAAAYAVDDPVVDETDVGDADQWLQIAETKMTAARDAIAALQGTAKKTPEQKALALAEKALAEIVKSRAAFAEDGPAYAKKYVALTATQQYGRALAILDLILPEELRSFLPGRGI